MSCPFRRLGAISSHLVERTADLQPVESLPSSSRSAIVAGSVAAPGPVTASNASALVKVGDENMFVNEAGEPDFPAGLSKMAAKVPADVGIGYYTSYRQDGEGNPLEKRVLLCTRPEFIEEIMAQETQHYLWGGIEPASVAFFGARVLFVLEGEEWSDLRKQMRPVLLPDNLPMVSKDVARGARKLVEALSPLAEKCEVVDLHLAHQCYHLQAISKALYNQELPTLDDFPKKHAVHESFNLMLEELARRAFHPDIDVQFNYKTKSEDNTLWHKNRDLIHDSVLTALRPRLRGDEECPVPGAGDLLQQLIQAHKEDHPNMSHEKSEEHLGANLVELLFAGYNTVVNTMSSAVYLLMANPEKLAKARVAVDACFKGRQDPPTFEDVQDKGPLHYLDLVMNETLRLYSPTPAIGRKLSVDTKMGEILVPADSEIMMPMCAIHHDTTYWENPAAFIPERFEAPIVKCSWMPFSDGPRRCLGQHYARMVFKFAMAQHLRYFDFEAVPGHRFKTAFNGFGSGVWDDRTNSPSFPVRISKRKL